MVTELWSVEGCMGDVDAHACIVYIVYIEYSIIGSHKQATINWV